MRRLGVIINELVNGDSVPYQMIGTFEPRRSPIGWNAVWTPQ